MYVFVRGGGAVIAPLPSPPSSKDCDVLLLLLLLVVTGCTDGIGKSYAKQVRTFGFVNSK